MRVFTRWPTRGHTGGTVGTVQTFYFVDDEAWTAERLARLPAVDAIIRLSRDLAQLGIYPTVAAVLSRLWLFFAQPFFAAEPYTRRPGVFVSRAEALRGGREILDGLHDDLPDEAFYSTGGIDEIRARARRAP